MGVISSSQTELEERQSQIARTHQRAVIALISEQCFIHWFQQTPSGFVLKKCGTNVETVF